MESTRKGSFETTDPAIDRFFFQFKGIIQYSVHDFQQYDITVDALHDIFARSEFLFIAVGPALK